MNVNHFWKPIKKKNLCRNRIPEMRLGEGSEILDSLFLSLSHQLQNFKDESKIRFNWKKDEQVTTEPRQSHRRHLFSDPSIHQKLGSNRGKGSSRSAVIVDPSQVLFSPNTI